MGLRPSLPNSFLMIVALLAAFLAPANAQPPQPARAGGLATVDVRILLMLHPMMATFDYSNGRFYRDESLKKNFQGVVQQLQKLQQESRKALATIESKKKRLMQTRLEIMTKREEALNDLSSKAASSSYNIRDKSRKISEFEQRYAAQLRQNTADLEALRTEMVKAQDAAIAPLYLTTEEAEKRLASIRDEIHGLIAQAAREGGYHTVVDNTFGFTTRKRAHDIPQVPALDESVDVVSSSLFHSFVNMDINPAVKSALQMPPNTTTAEEHMVAGRSIGMTDNLKQYLEFRNYMPEAVAGFGPGKFFLIGGNDLTPWVARQLFTKYRIPMTLQNSFMVLIRNFQDFERADFESAMKLNR
ncbi:hypothetical protein KBA41_10630 [Candidatus Ozemobacteraceae bacterium]|nr:hypothetical protein [Candidatus Ozemobacteraceae bacterium]